MNARAYWGVGLAALVFLLVQLGALVLLPTFFQQGFQTVKDPSDPTNSLLYIGAILVVTVLMLAAFKYDLHGAVRGVVILTGAMLTWYAFVALLPVTVTFGGVNVLSLLLAGGVGLALYRYPEWYVIDAAGILMGAAAAGLFGISFGLLPAIVLLTVLAVYDAISVYGTEHMLDLASGVMRLRIPVVLVIPLTLSYSLLDDEFGDEGTEDTDESGAADESDASDASKGSSGSGESGAPAAAAAATPTGGGDHGDVAATTDVNPERDAAAIDTDTDGSGADASDAPDHTEGVSMDDREVFFIGLGDAVMPTVMVASAAFFSSAPPLGLAALPALNLPALVAMLGTFVGLGVLLWAVTKGRPHAGLPLLNGGAVLGYLVGALAAGVPIAEALGLAQYL